MIFVLSGKDRFRLLRRRSDLKAEFFNEYPEGEYVALDVSLSPLSAARDIASASATDLFSANRMVEVEDAFDLPEDEKKKISVALAAAPPSVRFLFLSPSYGKSKDALGVFFGEHAKIKEEFPLLSREEARAFFLSEVRKSGCPVSCSRPACDRILSLYPDDSAALANLALTLSFYKEEGEITLADVELFLMGNPKEKVFVALDALLSGDRGGAVALLLREARIESGGVPKLFGLLAWQLRELLKIRGEYDAGNTRSADIAKSTGMHPFVAGKLISRIKDFPLSRLRKGFFLLSELDSDMKQGRADPELALTLFVQKF